MNSSWLQEIAQHGLRTTAPTLGVTVRRGNSAGPCPACGADQRGSDDRRGPLGFSGDGKAWACHASGCDASGDLADLLAYVRFKRRIRDLSAEETSSLAAEATRLGWCQPVGASDRASRARDQHGVRRATRTVGSGRAPAEPRESAVSGGTPNGGPFDWRDSLPGGACRYLWSGAPAAEHVLEYLRTQRGFSDATIRRWGLGAMPIAKEGKVQEVWLTIPYLDDKGQPVNVKFRRIPGPCLACSPDGGATRGPGCAVCADSKEPGMVPHKPKYRVCPARPMPLFAAKQLRQPDRPVIVVGGELDVISMDEYGWGENVVASTTGEGSNWPDEWLDRLEPFPSFLLAQDNDEAGAAGAYKLAEKLGKYRCSRVILPKNDVNECLTSGVLVSAVQAALDAASPVLNVKIVGPSGFATEIEALIHNPSAMVGLQCSSAKVNDGWGGLAAGLYVATGETGEGKTTFLTWLCWDLAGFAKEPCLLTSFEQRPIGTVQKVLRMEIGGDFTKATPAERAAAFAALDARGVYILDKYGDVTAEEVIEACRYARRRLGIRVHLIDHLDFICRVRPAGESERETKERVVRELATIGIEDDIIFLLVAHPNNLSRAQQRRVELGDLKGASAIRQDCHAGIVIEKMAQSKARPFPAACVHFDKVRSEFGKSGAQRVLAFDPVSLVYADEYEQTPAGRKGVSYVVP